MQDRDFEKRWRRRFTERGSQYDDDAAIAGWTSTGLASRVRQFEQLWHRAQPVGEIWLDIGCGAGTYTRMLRAEGRRPIGLDYSAPSVQKARDRSPAEIPWLAADVHHLPLPEGSADGILCFGVMQALAAPGPALNDMARVLRPGGELWVDALNAGCLPTRVSEHRRRRAGRAPHLRYDSHAGLEQAAREAGLEVLALYWLPLAPGRLAGMQKVLESRPMRGLLQALPPLAAGLSHSFILRARRV